MDAEDVAQETFLKAYFSLDQLQEDSAFPSWIATIATRLALDFIQKKKRTDIASIDVEEIRAEQKEMPVSYLDLSVRRVGAIGLLTFFGSMALVLILGVTVIGLPLETNMHQNVQMWIQHYGLFGVFFMLMVEMIGVPLPGETILAICGIEWSRGVFSLPALVAVAAIANIIGSILQGFRLGRKREKLCRNERKQEFR